MGNFFMYVSVPRKKICSTESACQCCGLLTPKFHYITNSRTKGKVGFPSDPSNFIPFFRFFRSFSLSSLLRKSLRRGPFDLMSSKKNPSSKQNLTLPQNQQKNNWNHRLEHINYVSFLRPRQIANIKTEFMREKNLQIFCWGI